jgi:hypothetical protein
MSEARALEGVYINLERAPARRAAMEAQLARLPYPVRRFAAIDGEARGGRPLELLPSQYGCWLSHLEVLAGAGAAHLHVMEDDVLLGARVAEIPNMLAMLDGSAQGGWDLFYLDAVLVEIQDMYAMFEWCASARRQDAVRLCQVPRDFTVYGTMSYVVNGARRARVAEFLASHRESGKAVDNVLAHGIRSGALEAYVAAPFVTSGLELGLESTIAASEDERQLAWLLFRRLCFDRPAPADLEQIDRRAARLDGATGRAEALLGRLMAYRIAHWPSTRFPPGLEAEGR